MRRLLLSAVILGALAAVAAWGPRADATLSAQSRQAPAGTAHTGKAFKFNQVKPGVYHAIGTGTLAVVGNSSVIVNDEDVIVVDDHVSGRGRPRCGPARARRDQRRSGRRRKARDHGQGGSRRSAARARCPVRGVVHARRARSGSLTEKRGRHPDLPRSRPEHPRPLDQGERGAVNVTLLLVDASRAHPLQRVRRALEAEASTRGFAFTLQHNDVFRVTHEVGA